jgi:hypothetical protein
MHFLCISEEDHHKGTKLTKHTKKSREGEEKTQRFTARSSAHPKGWRHTGRGKKFIRKKEEKRSTTKLSSLAGSAVGHTQRQLPGIGGADVLGGAFGCKDGNERDIIIWQCFINGFPGDDPF